MKPMMALFFLFLLSAQTQAHFVWLVPDEKKTNTASLIFSDSLQPDDNVPITKIGQTKVFARNDSGKSSQTIMKQGKNAYAVSVEAKGPHTLAGICQYGVVSKGKNDPFLLVYHAKTIVGLKDNESPPGNFFSPWNDLPLEIVPHPVKASCRVSWQGKPLTGAEVFQMAPGLAKLAERKSDENGDFSVEISRKKGLYGIRVRHVETREGELDGKKYKEIRHYATLTFSLPEEKNLPKAEKKFKDPALGLGGTFVLFQKEDSGASKLLADARAARLLWKNFPGLSADLEINHNGKISKGKVSVSSEGKVNLDLKDQEILAWAKREIGSLVSHRLDSGSPRNTPCAFIDDNKDHPQGRLVKVLNDELHSSYRIRDRQILEVNRTAGDIRFTITVLENKVIPLNRITFLDDAENPKKPGPSAKDDKHFLPIAYAVNTWDVKSGVLRSSQMHHHAWIRVGAFDLPASFQVVTATGKGLDSKQVIFHNLRLVGEKK